MRLFHRDTPVWRDRSGTIRCPGDNCPQRECDDSCPIWLHTVGQRLLVIGQGEKALPLYQQAVGIAPDFHEAWNNMGGIYGQLGQYEQARQCYLKARELNPNKATTVYGLVLAARDIGDWEDCIRWCDEYDRLASDHRCDDIRAAARQMLDKSSARHETGNVSSERMVEVLQELLAFGAKEGFLLNGGTAPIVPELASQAQDVCTRVIEGMRADLPDQLLPAVLLASGYAGMGAVRFWYDDWPRLQCEGVYESLVAPRGLVDMDEFVTDYIGWNFGSEKSERLREHMNVAAAKAIMKASDGMKNADVGTLLTAAMGMYLYGIAVEMHNLGLD